MNEAAQRARLRFGKNRYRLMTNDCEHFCAWCLYGASRSEQVHASTRLSPRGYRHHRSHPSQLMRTFASITTLAHFATSLFIIAASCSGVLAIQDGTLTTQTRHQIGRCNYLRHLCVQQLDDLFQRASGRKQCEPVFWRRNRAGRLRQELGYLEL